MRRRLFFFLFLSVCLVYSCSKLPTATEPALSPTNAPPSDDAAPSALSPTAATPTADPEYVNRTLRYNLLVPYVTPMGAETAAYVSGTLAEEVLMPDPGDPFAMYTSDSQHVVETTRFVLLLDEGVTVSRNALQLINDCMDFVEDASGLSFFTDAMYAHDVLRPAATLDFLVRLQFPDTLFYTFDPTHEKPLIVVTDAYRPQAVAGGISLNAVDLSYPSYDLWAVCHELFHCLQYRNGIRLPAVLEEGFSTCLTARILSEDTQYQHTFESEQNYAFSEGTFALTPEHAENLFLTLNGFDAQIYGYHFFSFLTDTLGDGWFPSFLAAATAQEADASVTIRLLKELTNESLFSNFVSWCLQPDADGRPGALPEDR